MTMGHTRNNAGSRWGPLCLATLISALSAAAGATGAAAACGARVQTGYNESALALSSRCGTTLHDLRLANPGLDIDRPLSNQLIRVPDGRGSARIPEALKTPAPGRQRLVPPVSRSHVPVDPKDMEEARKASRQRHVYRIRPGDTLSAIAAARGVSLTTLLGANPGVEPRRLAVGQAIVIP